ncbi:very short patch repair endonuclease [Paraburkholderia tropica]|uniref:very short patch repair endonuclease n=1 Tax=Paraburkholderia tropica TaxID=92647 RepID=UPI0031D5D037
MVDTLTKEARSALMSRVRQKDTSPEVRLRKRLHAEGLRYVLHPPSLPGRPDLVFPKHRIVVFVHGCFWHGHTCRAGRVASSNHSYWSAKIAANQARDHRKAAELLALGWRVATVWECETKGARLDQTVSFMTELIRSDDLPEGA